MLPSICVETVFAEERTEDHGTTSSQLRRSDRDITKSGVNNNVMKCLLLVFLKFPSIDSLLGPQALYCVCTVRVPYSQQVVSERQVSLAEMAKDGSVMIDKFDGSDIGIWRMQIEDVLYQKKLHEQLSKIKLEDMKEDDRLLLDRQALGVVRLSLAKNVAYNIASIKTTHDLLKALSDMYERPSTANKVFLIRQLVNLKMREGRSATDHINEVNSIWSRLTSVGIGFEDEVQALLLLSSLPES
ncbi:hypothetical protein LXL04_034824 [Taraxacum kok-saghyz]